MSDIYALDGVAPEIDPSAWTAPGARVIGAVRLEAQSSVWFNAVLRGDNEPITIGARSNVQDGCVLHTDPGFPLTVGVGCTIGHKALLHGCVIENGVLIGMGATILNGARIPTGCLVGACALITEGKTFEPGSMILGAPARAVRALDPNVQANIAMLSETYVARAERFREGLTPIA